LAAIDAISSNSATVYLDDSHRSAPPRKKSLSLSENLIDTSAGEAAQCLSNRPTAEPRKVIRGILVQIMNSHEDNTGSTPTIENNASRAPAVRPARPPGSPFLAGIVFLLCAGVDLLWNPPLLILGPLGLLILLAFLRLRKAAIVTALLIIVIRLGLAIHWIVLVTGREDLDALGFVFLLLPYAPQVLLLVSGLELLRRGLFLSDESSPNATTEPSPAQSLPSVGQSCPSSAGRTHRIVDRLAWVVVALVVAGGIAATAVVLFDRSGADVHLRLDSPEQIVTLSDGSKVAVAIRTASDAVRQIWTPGRDYPPSLDATQDFLALMVRNETSDRLRLQMQLYTLVQEQGRVEHVLFIGPDHCSLLPANFSLPDNAELLRDGRRYEFQLGPGETTARPIPASVSQETVKLVR
jgi:hypothetical protein